ncbi:sulfotransferase family protein [Actibacterium pelagium]|nr:sulfotransferase [Actibacterium pelagium]
MYGIGATKAGTSWLYRYLASHPECAMPPVKELHYFNTDTPEALELQMDRLARHAVTTDEGGIVGGRRYRVLEEASEMLTAPRDGDAAYLEYLMGQAAQARLVGDITPAYSMLPAKTFERMSKLAQTTRFIYLIRDPVARLWSNVRMVALRKEKAKTDYAGVSNRIMDRTLRKSDHRALKRSNYKATLEALEAAVPAASRLVLFFEELFTEKTVRRICDFLGLSYVPGDFSFRVNEGPALALDDDRRASAQQLLRDQYEAVAQRFGHLPEAWQRNMVGV